MLHSSVNISTIVLAVLIILLTLLETRYLKLVLLKTVISQVSILRMVSSKPTLNHRSLLVLLLSDPIVFAFLLRQTAELFLAHPYLLACLLRLLLVYLPRRRIPLLGSRNNLERRLVLLDLFKLLMLMRVFLDFLESRLLLVLLLLLFSCRKGRCWEQDNLI